MNQASEINRRVLGRSGEGGIGNQLIAGCNKEKRKNIPMEIRTLGIDLAKRIFQLHGVDAKGNVVLKKRKEEVFFAALSRKKYGVGLID